MQNKSNSGNVDIEKMLAEMRLGYIAELPARLQEIEAIVLELKNSDSFTEDYQSIYRHIHSIKGSAGTHGLQIISTICHVFEDKVIEVEGNQELISDEFIKSMLSFIDLLNLALDLISGNAENFAEIEAELDRLSGKGSTYELRGMVVMASALHRKLVTNAFEKFPVKFRYITSGYEALGLLLNEPFDLLVTNMEVPDLQGLPIISVLRISNNRNREMPSILLTSGHVPSYGKSIDPDYVIKRDADLMENLTLAAGNIVRKLTAK